MIKVIFIVGAGRSGSTVLNAMLGKASDALAVGELSNLAQFGWVNGEYCACGQRVPECSFWNEVRESMRAAGTSPDNLVASQDAVERFRNSHRAFLSVGKPVLKEYGRLTTEMFEAIATASGSSTVIDASKNPSRAIALAKNANIDLRVIHLVRDVRGVAWSLKKPYRKDMAGGVQRDMPGRPLLRSVAFWCLTNLLSELAAMSVTPDKRIRIRYEDLVLDPQRTLKDVSTVTGLSLDDTIECVERGDAFPFEHTVAGNRVRMSKGVTLNADFEWRSSMSKSLQTRLRWLAWPWMHRYGYE